MLTEIRGGPFRETSRDVLRLAGEANQVHGIAYGNTSTSGFLNVDGCTAGQNIPGVPRGAMLFCRSKVSLTWMSRTRAGEKVAIPVVNHNLM